MKRRIIIGVVLVAALIAAGLTTRWWLAPLLRFAGTNANTIQGLSSLVQLLLWGVAGVVAWWRLIKSHKPAEPPNPPPIAMDTFLHQMPPALEDFTDRVEEVAELKGKLDNDTRIYGLFGMGGIGKSDLAKKFAEMHLSDRYPDAQLYVDLKGSSREPKSVSDAQRHIISSCRGSERLYKSEGVDLSAKYNDALYDKRALIVLDNASSSEQVAPLTPPAKCAMLVTSRQKIYLPGMHAMTLTPLSPEDARDLLLKIAPRIGDRADRIAKLCGGLPQALRIAASTIATHPDLQVDDYVEALTDKNRRLKFVEASLDFTYDLLPAIQQRQFCRLAIFPETFDARGAAAVWDQPVEGARVDLSEFFQMSLVEWHEQIGRYHLQSLVRDFADAHLSDSDRSNTQWRHTTYYLKVLKEAGEQYLQGYKSSQEGRNLFDLESANIQAAQSAIQNQLASDSITELARDSYTYGASQLLSLKQPPSDRINWHQALLNVLKKSASVNNKVQLAEAGNLTFIGVACRDLGDYGQTIKHCEEAATIALQLNDLREESNALGYAGVAHYYTGNYEEASKYIQRQSSSQARVRTKMRLAILRDSGTSGMHSAAWGNMRRLLQPMSFR